MKKYVDNVISETSVKFISLSSIFISFIIYELTIYIDSDLVINNIDIRYLTLIFLTVLIIVIFVIRYVFATLIRNKATNFSDSMSLILFLSLLTNCVLNSKLFAQYDYSFFIGYLTASILTLIIIIYRIVLVNKKNSYHTSIYDLKDLIDSKIEKDSRNVLFDECAVQYDLLNRTFLIEQITETIRTLNPSRKFVISLEGTWGSGKSTIINLMKENLSNSKEIMVIDSFEPWAFNDEISMLKGIIRSILEKIDLGIPSFKVKRMMNTFIDSVFEKKGVSFLTHLFFEDVDKTEYEIMKIINSHLEGNNITLLFIIDNLDRTQQEHIFFVYKSIAGLLNIKKVIYLLSFDNTIVKSAFDNLGINSKYINKIIQKRFIVPVDPDRLNSIMLQSLKKYCELCEFDISKLTDNDLLEIIKPIEDLREFKLFINQLANILKSNLKVLNSFDLLAISVIRITCPSLLENIYLNAQYFVTEGVGIGFALSRYPEEKFEEQAKVYFKSLFSKKDWENYIPLLDLMFPVIKNVKGNYSNIYSSHSYDTQLSEKNRKISNAKYFPIYFTNTINRFIHIGNIADSLINSSINSKILDEDVKVLDEIVRKSNPTSQVLILEALYNQLSVLNIDNSRLLINYLIENIELFDDSFVSFQLNARNRLYALIGKLFSKMSFEIFSEIVKQKFSSYRHLNNIRSIKYWLSPEAKEINEFEQEKFEFLGNYIKQKVDSIINKNLDIFEKDFYSKYNSRVIIWEYQIESQKLITYFRNIINPDNISKLINDFIQVSSSSDGFGYRVITEELYKCYSKEMIAAMRKLITPSLDNDFIMEVYDKSVDLKPNSFNSAVLVPEQIKRFGNY